MKKPHLVVAWTLVTMLGMENGCSTPVDVLTEDAGAPKDTALGAAGGPGSSGAASSSGGAGAAAAGATGGGGRDAEASGVDAPATGVDASPDPAAAAGSGGNTVAAGGRDGGNAGAGGTGKAGASGSSGSGGISGSSGQAGSTGRAGPGGGAGRDAAAVSVDGSGGGDALPVGAGCAFECKTNSSGVTGWFLGEELVCPSDCLGCVSALPHAPSTGVDCHPLLYFRLCKDCAPVTLSYGLSQSVAPELESVWSWFDQRTSLPAKDNPRNFCSTPASGTP